MRTPEVELVKQALRAPGPIEDKVAALADARKISEKASQQMDEYMLAEVMRVHRELRTVGEEQEKLRKLIERMTMPPLFPAVFMDHFAQGLLVMLPGGARRVVGHAKECDPAGLRPGAEVFLNSDLNMVIGAGPASLLNGGELAAFDRRLDGNRIVLRFRDEEFVLAAVEPLLSELETVTAGDMIRFDRNTMLAIERVSRTSGERFFETTPPKATFADIGGLHEQIEEMKSLVALRFFHTEQAARYGLTANSALLLEGPPGTGKTMLAGALAHWMGELAGGDPVWISVKPGELRNEWYGATERLTRQCFQAAREAGARDPRIPVLLFFDEIDAICGARGRSGAHVDDRVLQAFAAELDGVAARGNVLVIGATNRRHALDAAILRPGRFGDKAIQVPRPNMSAARSILAKHLAEDYPFENGPSKREAVIESAVSRLYAPNATGALCKLVLRDGTVREVKAADLLSGASLANIARAARERACWREVAGEALGIRAHDVFTAIDKELEAISRVLTPLNAGDHIAGLPDDIDVIRVERPVRRPGAAHKYLSAVA